jgi:hypothetical protein
MPSENFCIGGESSRAVAAGDHQTANSIASHSKD